MNNKEQAIEAIRGSDAYKCFLKARADVSVFKGRSGERDKAIVDTKEDIRKLDELRVKEEDAYRQVLGTSGEEEALRRVESTRAALEAKRKRLQTLKELKQNSNAPNMLEALRRKEHSFWNKCLALIVERELEDFPEEARKVLARAYAVAVETDWVDWEPILDKTLGLPKDERISRRIGSEVIKEYFPDQE